MIHEQSFFWSSHSRYRQDMAKGAFSLLATACCWLFVLALALVGAFVGWLSTTWLPEGFAFASLIPLVGGGLPPPPLFGPFATPLTPSVPDDLTPQPRPAGEIFLKLAGTGDSMPANGLGMCCRPSAYDDETVRRSVLWYLLNGGRHIDTAQLYLNHKPIGVAIEQAIKRGVPRSEIWLTTKLHERFYGHGEEAILGMVQEWMQELRVDYLDLVLLHQPEPMLPLGHKCTNWAQCRKSAWQALAAARGKGWIRNIGGKLASASAPCLHRRLVSLCVFFLRGTLRPCAVSSELNRNLSDACSLEFQHRDAQGAGGTQHRAHCRQSVHAQVTE